MSKAALEDCRLALLQGKTWRYLRYIHTREVFQRVAPSITSALVIGAGHGLAEIALAAEFPKIQFTLTDHGGATHNQTKARQLVELHNLKNVQFEQLDILAPDVEAGVADLVFSVEVLEHLLDYELAARNMRKLAKQYVFCLVPFAEAALNANPERRARALEKFEHHVVGYDAATLVSLFPNPKLIRGCYWKEGQAFRVRLTALEPAEIKVEAKSLMTEAKKDIRDEIPARMQEALGIMILSPV